MLKYIELKSDQNDRGPAWIARVKLSKSGDIRPQPESRLAILPNTTHVTLMNRRQTIVPMVTDFLDAKASKQ